MEWHVLPGSGVKFARLVAGNCHCRLAVRSVYRQPEKHLAQQKNQAFPPNLETVIRTRRQTLPLFFPSLVATAVPAVFAGVFIVAFVVVFASLTAKSRVFGAKVSSTELAEPTLSPESFLFMPSWGAWSGLTAPDPCSKSSPLAAGSPRRYSMPCSRLSFSKLSCLSARSACALTIFSGWW